MIGDGLHYTARPPWGSTVSAKPSIPPQGVPSGNGKFIVIAVLLLGSIAGVTIWQLTKKPQEQPVLIVDAGPPPTVTTAGRDPTEDIPVVEALPDASDKKTPTTVTQAGGGSGQCDVKKCTGKTTSELETALAFRTRQAHRCYDNALGQDPTLKGKITVSVRVATNGVSCPNGVSIASNEMGSSTVANCVLGYYRGQSFPAPAGGCADVNIPINFVPRQ